MPPTRRGRLLLGAFPTAAAAVSYTARVSSLNAAEVERRWPATREAFLASDSRPADSGEATADPATLEALDAALREPLFRASVAGHSWQVATIELAALVTQQPLAQLDRIAALEQRLRTESLLPILFPARASVEARVEAPGGTAIALLTERADLVISKIEARQTDGAGPIEVAFRLEPRPNYLTVLRRHSALLLRNGNHRLIAACRCGLRRLPCILIDANQEHWQARPDRFPLDALEAARPPRITDLTQPSAATLDLDLQPRQLITLIRAEQHWSTTR